MPQLPLTAATGHRPWHIWRPRRSLKVKREASGPRVWQMFAIRRQINDTFDGGLVTLGFPEGL